ncbi:hypothetical protein H671_6g15719 [Cricetulus griseus]|uniref:Uncharacterized protein n=1 Tax=Cricetulus griseus TaxID=10029 RepID=A0A061I4A4_CRIGR|nr:hypothetical protein H671_6g15719 [Cricetulus griseus]
MSLSRPGDPKSIITPTLAPQTSHRFWGTWSTPCHSRSVTQDSHTAIEKLSFNTYPEVYGDNSQELTSLIEFATAAGRPGGPLPGNIRRDRGGEMSKIGRRWGRLAWLPAMLAAGIWSGSADGKARRGLFSHQVPTKGSSFLSMSMSNVHSSYEFSQARLQASPHKRMLEYE